MGDVDLPIAVVGAYPGKDLGIETQCRKLVNQIFSGRCVLRGTDWMRRCSDGTNMDQCSFGGERFCWRTCWNRVRRTQESDGKNRDEHHQRPNQERTVPDARTLFDGDRFGYRLRAHDNLPKDYEECRSDGLD